MPFGLIDTQYIDFPHGTDPDYIRSLSTEGGIEMVDLIRLVDSAMGALNTGVNPLVAALTAPTTNSVAGKRRTTVKRAQRGGQYTMARPQYGESVAHMLPITDLEIALGFTEKGLNKISRDAFAEELNDMVSGIQLLYLIETLERLFDPAEVPVDDRTAAVSPGFAGSGTGTNVFTGVFPNGTAVPGGYTHYKRGPVGNLAANVKELRDKIKRWGHTAPFDLIPSQAAFEAVIADTANFVDAGSSLIRQGANADEAVVDAEVYAGVYLKDIRVRYPVLELGESNHLAIVKTYGNFDPRNPLAWRYNERVGRDAFVRSRELYPLVNAQVMQEYGIGVANRVGAGLLQIAASGTDYAPPALAY